MAYSDKVLDHYSNPRTVGSMDKNSNEVGTGLVGAPDRDDMLTLPINVNTQTKIIEIVKELALPPVKIHCSVLAEDAIRAAIHDWKAKQGAAKPVAVEAK